MYTTDGADGAPSLLIILEQWCPLLVKPKLSVKESMSSQGDKLCYVSLDDLSSHVND